MTDLSHIKEWMLRNPDEAAKIIEFASTDVSLAGVFAAGDLSTLKSFVSLGLNINECQISYKMYSIEVAQYLLMKGLSITETTHYNFRFLLLEIIQFMLTAGGPIPRSFLMPPRHDQEVTRLISL